MDYEDWISRERRLRIKLLMQSPEIKLKGLFRICQDCDEVCLCHELLCPNCGGDDIDQTPMDRAEVKRGHLIRCLLRFKTLSEV